VRESWRHPELEEWGKAIALIAEPTLHALKKLHKDAAKTLPPNTRYDIRISAELLMGGGMAWYSHSLMAKEETWNGFGQREGYYLVGQYTTPLVLA